MTAREHEWEVRAYTNADDALWTSDDRFTDQKDALHQKALWERAGAGRVTIEQVSTAKAAHQEDDCLLCVAAPHPNCKKYTVVQMLVPGSVPLGESYENHLVPVPVCLEHYQAFEQYREGKNVAEVDV
ncbi:MULTISPECIES: hypothetical protein [Halorussus]|uniref:hypothetical protein n=1 Tax=Halorussus TaxID=1070314 RepID=UPI0020A125F6|nr:hypothetical protein [Halorussus vallis]USZ78724.1 hypothetical protein NGM07_24750 [Halorussus vallis]